MHGRLEPRLVLLAWASGIFGFQPMVTYRLNDNILLSGTWAAIESSRRAILGTFRAHDMVPLRLTRRRARRSADAVSDRRRAAPRPHTRTRVSCGKNTV